MTQQSTDSQAQEIAAPKPRKPQSRAISARVRHAINLRVEKRLTGEEAARAAGLSSAGFWKAWKQPKVQALYAELKSQHIKRQADKLDLIKAHAVDVIEELLDPSQPPQIRAKMVELLRREAQSAPLVQINMNSPAQGFDGYSYPRPDTQSGAIEGQAVEGPTQSDDVATEE